MKPRAHKPKPFSRPSISIAVNEVARAWQHISPELLEEGDTVADFGTLSKVIIRRRHQEFATIVVDEIESGITPINSVEIIGLNPLHTKMYDPTAVVFAFSRIRS